MLMDVTRLTLEKALDATALRHRAIANNLANVETPGYERQDISFEAQLRSALEPSTPGGPSQESQVADVTAQTLDDASQPARENGNNVDADREMARLAENTIHYEALIQSMSLRDGMLKTAIWEGKK